MRKQVLGIAAVWAVCAGLCMAQGFFLGGHGAYTIGGDVEESDFGFGVQGGVDISDAVSLELSWSRFSDEASEGFVTLSADMNVIGATARYGFEVSDVLKPYVGAGLDYLMIDAEATIRIPQETRAELESLANSYGVGLGDLVDESVLSGRSMEIELDNTIGYHVCAGVNWAITEQIQAIGEYRYTFGSIKGDGIDEDYTYGMLRLGANFLL